MSGLLAHLVARTLNDRTRILPRPVSLYEPEPEAPAGDIPAARVELTSGVLDGERPSTRTQPAYEISANPSQARLAPGAPARAPKQRPAGNNPSVSPSPRPPSAQFPGAMQGLPMSSSPGAEAVQPPATEDQVEGHAHVTVEVIPTIGHAPPPRPEAEPVEPLRLQHTGGVDAQPLALTATESAKRGTRPPVEGEIREMSSGEPPVATEASVPIQYRFRRQVQILARSVARTSSQPVSPGGGEDRPQTRMPAHAGEGRVGSGHAAAERPMQPTIGAAPAPLSALPGKTSAPVQAVLLPRLPQQPDSRPYAPAHKETTEPVVHVSIGRVEIRAITLPQTPKREAPRPALSLSEYLRRRSEDRQ